MAAGKAVVQAGVDLGYSDEAWVEAKAALDAAEKERDRRQEVWDDAYMVYAVGVEQHSVTPADIAGAGLVVQERASYTLDVPTSVTARWDVLKSGVRVNVKSAPGIMACVVDYCAGPVGSSPWQRVPGISLRPLIANLTPGIYWVRAAGVRGADQSAFSDPIAVVVK